MNTNNLQGQLEELKAFGTRQETRESIASRNWCTLSQMHAIYLWANKHCPLLIFPYKGKENLSVNEIIYRHHSRLLKRLIWKTWKKSITRKSGKSFGIKTCLVNAMNEVQGISSFSLREKDHIKFLLTFTMLHNEQACITKLVTKMRATTAHAWTLGIILMLLDEITQKKTNILT